MQRTEFGRLGQVSRLTLGGGGIGQVWGETTREEGIATIKMAIDAGIDVLDAAPGYYICEELIGETFGGRMPEHIKLTTKYGLRAAPPEEVYDRFRTSLEASLKAMRVDRVDLLFLHNEIWPDGRTGPDGREDTPWSLYRDHAIPAFERLMADGLIGGWGLTGAAMAPQILDALRTAPRPHAVQAVANLLDMPVGVDEHNVAERPRHREIIAAAKENGVGVMGIRALQAGALTRGFDRELPEDQVPLGGDFERAAPFRSLCAQWGEDPATIAHRYALGMEGVETLILGVKNRDELQAALDAETAGPLDDEQVRAIEALGLREAVRESA